MSSQANPQAHIAAASIRGSSYKKRVASTVTLIGIGLSLMLFFPLIGVLFCVLAIALSIPNSRFACILPMGYVIGVFAWMNSHKEINGDWSWYTKHYQMLQTLPLSQYIGHGFFPGIYIKPSEPLYYLVSYSLSRVSGGDIAVLAIAVTLIVYGALATALITLLHHYKIPPIVSAFSVMCSLLIGITFSLTTHLVRQEIAMALLFLGVVLMVSGRRRWGILAIAAALFTHNSAVIPILVVCTTFLLIRSGHGLKSWWGVSALISFLCLGFYFGIVTARDIDLSRSDGSINLLVATVQVFIIGAAVVLHRRSQTFCELSKLLTISTCLFAAFLTGVSPRLIALLRTYFYSELLSLIALCMLFAKVLSRYFALSVLPLCALAVVYFEVRLASSPFSFQGGLIKHLLFTRLIG